VCGEVDGVQLETIAVRNTGWWVALMASPALCATFSPIVLWLLLSAEAPEVRLPFTAQCFKTWARVRLASRVLMLIAFPMPCMGAILGTWASPSDLFLKACATGLVLLVLPALLRFGPPMLGPVFGVMYGGAVDVHLPSAEAAAALERAGWV
jgi:hypothetical protein